jgi:hypothetical protein
LAAIVLWALPAAAQSPEAPQGGPGASQPGPAKTQAPRFAENFDRDPVSGWEYHSQYAFPAAGKGRALATKGAAVWVAAGEVADFTMKLRFGYERGIGLVDFRHARRYGISDRYTLLLSRRGVGLIRVKDLPNEVEEKELASAPVSLAPQTWHDVIIQAAGGRIKVWIDGKGVLDARDPKPLRPGMCALSVEAGVVLYDDVILIPQGKADQHGLASDPAKWASWSAAGKQTETVENPSAPSDDSSPRHTKAQQDSTATTGPHPEP